MNTLYSQSKRLHRLRWPAITGAALIGMSVVCAAPPAQADLFDIIFQGIRIIEISNMSEAKEILVPSQFV